MPRRFVCSGVPADNLPLLSWSYLLKLVFQCRWPAITYYTHPCRDSLSLYDVTDVPRALHCSYLGTAVVLVKPPTDHSLCSYCLILQRSGSRRLTSVSCSTHVERLLLCRESAVDITSQPRLSAPSCIWQVSREFLFAPRSLDGCMP